MRARRGRNGGGPGRRVATAARRGWSTPWRGAVGGSLAAGFWCGEEWWRRDAEPPMPVAPRHPFPRVTIRFVFLCRYATCLRTRLWWNTLSAHRNVIYLVSLKECRRRLAGCGVFLLSKRASERATRRVAVGEGGSEAPENAGRIERHRLRRSQVPGKQQRRCLLELSRAASLDPLPPPSSLQARCIADVRADAGSTTFLAGTLSLKEENEVRLLRRRCCGDCAFDWSPFLSAEMA